MSLTKCSALVSSLHPTPLIRTCTGGENREIAETNSVRRAPVQSDDVIWTEPNNVTTTGNRKINSGKVAGTVSLFQLVNSMINIHGALV